MRWETREAWGARPPKSRSTHVTLRGVAIHYPGVDVPFRAMSHDLHRAQLRSWQAQHMNRGSVDLEYGAVLCPCGTLMEGRIEADRPRTRVGSNGTYEANTTHTSVQLMVGTREGVTDAEVRWLGEAVAWLRGHGWGDEVKGHRDFYPTACPGDALYRRLGDVRRHADAIREDEDMPTPEEIAEAVWGHPVDDEGRSARWAVNRAGRIVRRYLGPNGDPPANDTMLKQMHQRLKRIEKQLGMDG